MILLYHRIASGFDPLGLNVSPGSFADHLDVITRYTVPCRLEDLVRRVREGRLAQPLSAVTFDDGYQDNLLVAAPMLERSGVPATVFVTPCARNGVREMWWDELARLVFDSSPALINGDPDPPAQPEATYVRLYGDLRRTPPGERELILANMRASQVAHSAPLHPLLEPFEIGELGARAGIEIGGHTMSHPTLSSLPAAQQLEEIKAGRATLAEILGHVPTTFAYPFGTPADYDRHSVRAVSEVGYTLGCANFASAVGRSSPILELPRILVRDWPVDEFERRLAGALGQRS